jgi:hypothetical protein
VKAVTNGHNPGNLSLASFLDDNELLNRVIHNQTHMGVSIKILHGLVQKKRFVFYPKLDILIITYLFVGVNEEHCHKSG